MNIQNVRRLLKTVQEAKSAEKRSRELPYKIWIETIPKYGKRKDEMKMKTDNRL